MLAVFMKEVQELICVYDQPIEYKAGRQRLQTVRWRYIPPAEAIYIDGNRIEHASRMIPFLE